jgi:hypothetical protein
MMLAYRVVTEPEPRQQEDAPEHDYFWNYFIGASILAVVAFPLLALTRGGFGVQDPGPVGYLISGAILVAGAWLVFKGVRMKSFGFALIGLVLVFFSCLGFAGVAFAECEPTTYSAGGDCGD